MRQTYSDGVYDRDRAMRIAEIMRRYSRNIGNTRSWKSPEDNDRRYSRSTYMGLNEG